MNDGKKLLHVRMNIRDEDPIVKAIKPLEVLDVNTKNKNVFIKLWEYKDYNVLLVQDMDKWKQWI